MKNIVVFGGGTGLSCLLSGLKLFPVRVTCVIAVSDNGSSSGVLKDELDIPAVGDIGKVLLSMANTDEDFLELLSYRFSKSGSLYNQPVRNIMLAALIDLKGNLAEATKYMCRLLNINGNVLPLTSEKVDLVGRSGKETFYGEEAVSSNMHHIRKLSYDHDIRICSDITSAIEEADLIVFSPGSLFTSIIPHLIVEDVRRALDQSPAPIMYISNLVTQPGETEGFKVSDHVRTLNRYLGKKRKVDIVVANKGSISAEIAGHYLELENKSIVEADEAAIRKEGAALIPDDIFTITDGKIRHDALKTAYRIFSYLMEQT